VSIPSGYTSEQWRAKAVERALSVARTIEQELRLEDEALAVADGEWQQAEKEDEGQAVEAAKATEWEEYIRQAERGGGEEWEPEDAYELRDHDEELAEGGDEIPTVSPHAVMRIAKKRALAEKRAKRASVLRPEQSKRFRKSKPTASPLQAVVLPSALVRRHDDRHSRTRSPDARTVWIKRDDLLSSSYPGRVVCRCVCVDVGRGCV
jgi:hypothetical protein